MASTIACSATMLSMPFVCKLAPSATFLWLPLIADYEVTASFMSKYGDLFCAAGAASRAVFAFSTLNQERLCRQSGCSAASPCHPLLRCVAAWPMVSPQKLLLTHFVRLHRCHRSRSCVILPRRHLGCVHKLHMRRHRSGALHQTSRNGTHALASDG